MRFLPMLKRPEHMYIWNTVIRRRHTLMRLTDPKQCRNPHDAADNVTPDADTEASLSYIFEPRCYSNSTDSNRARTTSNRSPSTCTSSTDDSKT